MRSPDYGLSIHRLPSWASKPLAKSITSVTASSPFASIGNTMAVHETSPLKNSGNSTTKMHVAAGMERRPFRSIGNRMAMREASPFKSVGNTMKVRGTTGTERRPLGNIGNSIAVEISSRSKTASRPFKKRQIIGPETAPKKTSITVAVGVSGDRPARGLQRAIEKGTRPAAGVSGDRLVPSFQRAVGSDIRFLKRKERHEDTRITKQARLKTPTTGNDRTTDRTDQVSFSADEDWWLTFEEVKMTYEAQGDLSTEDGWLSQWLTCQRKSLRGLSPIKSFAIRSLGHVKTKTRKSTGEEQMESRFTQPMASNNSTSEKQLAVDSIKHTVVRSREDIEEEKWELRFNELAAADFSINNDKSLQCWLYYQRKLANENLLMPQRRQKLEAAGIDLQLHEYRPDDEQWEMRFNELLSANGSPQVGTGVYDWLYKQRKQVSNNSLKPERRQKLEAAGIDLRPNAETKWMVMYTHLKNYKAMYGHCDVPHKYPVNPKLGNWVRTQRKKYSGDHTYTNPTQAQIQQLEAIGFQWKVPRGRPPSVG